MTQILKEGGKTIIKTGERIDTMNATQFEEDIQPALADGGLDLEMDCSDLTYMASSGPENPAYRDAAEGAVQDDQCKPRNLQGAGHDRLHQIHEGREESRITPFALC